MKKLLILLSALVLSGTMIAVTANTTASDRKAKREAREVQNIGEMKAALATQSFTFYPNSYTLPYQNPVETYGTTDLYLVFYPEDIDINLPFEVNQGKEFRFDSQFVKYQDYKVAATKQTNSYIVTAHLSNVSNMGIDADLTNQAMNIGIHINVNVATGSAYMTLTPDFSAAVTYRGTIRY